ncbi:hypothetical protein GGR50DRAFT_83331 [Xylaria sp. CBS 124048]|nr:hypothetical protein GGR50DRAFT_83331 [Xylaria sp. CBS 124048]
MTREIKTNWPTLLPPSNQVQHLPIELLSVFVSLVCLRHPIRWANMQADCCTNDVSHLFYLCVICFPSLINCRLICYVRSTCLPMFFSFFFFFSPLSTLKVLHLWRTSAYSTGVGAVGRRRAIRRFRDPVYRVRSAPYTTPYTTPSCYLRYLLRYNYLGCESKFHTHTSKCPPKNPNV